MAGTRGAAGFGTDPGSIDWSALGPDIKGTYEVDQPGRIVLRYENGTVDTRFIAAMQNDAHVFDPAAGLMLGRRTYFTP